MEDKYFIEQLNEYEWKHTLEEKSFLLPFSEHVLELKPNYCSLCKNHAGSGMSWCKNCRQKLNEDDFKYYKSSLIQLKRKLNTGYWFSKEDPEVAKKSVKTLKKRIKQDPSLYDKLYNHGKKTKSKEVWISRLRKAHGDKYDYSLLPDKIKSAQKVKILCPIHGEFEQNIDNHSRGHGCKKCITEDRAMGKDDFIKASMKHHGDKYDYSLLPDKIKISHKVQIICPEHGEFEQLAESHKNGHGCRKCSLTGPSKSENELFDWVKELFPNSIQSNRDILGGKELDVFIPENRIAIEYCGLYWHSEKFKHRNYHKDKYDECLDNNIRLITIFEDEWLQDKDKVKRAIKSISGIRENGKGARQLYVDEIDKTLARDFFKKYHLQNSTPLKCAYALFDGVVPVAVMGFGHPTRNTKKYNWELKRFATNGRTYPGAASRLFKRFLKDINPDEVMSISDNRWFDGKMYELLGFEMDGHLKPGYYYVSGYNRYHCSKFSKAGLKRNYPEIYNENKTEFEMAKEAGLLKLYDCGKKRWIFKNVII